jgi:hypothetical protein
MSTKSTLAYADDFHFYTELFDERHVYLELRGVDFVAARDRVTVPIPLAIWEVIRTLGGVEDLSLVETSDDELRALAEADVDAGIAAYESDPDRDTPQRAWVHSGANRPREEQVAEALEEYQASRQRQQEIHAAIQIIRNKNRSRLMATPAPASTNEPPPQSERDDSTTMQPTTQTTLTRS